jgi:hypothetical protein
MFRHFRHHILPCHRAMATANQRRVYCSRFPGGSCVSANHILGLYARSRQVSIQQIRAHATDDRTRSLPLAPLFGISLARHKVMILQYLFRVVRIPSSSFSVLPCFLHGSRKWLDWCASLSSPVASFTVPNSYRCPFLAFTQSDIPPQRIAAKP